MPFNPTGDRHGKLLPNFGNGGLIVPYKADTHIREGESPVTSFNWDDGGRATRIFDVDWNDQYDAVWQILGAVSYAAGQNTQTRWLPEVHPNYPHLVAARINNIKGVGTRTPAGTQQFEQIGTQKIAVFSRAHITVEYEVPEYPVLPDSAIQSETERYTKIEWKYNGDYLSLPTPGLMKWTAGDNNGQTFVGQIGKIVGTIDLKFTWYRVAYEGVNFTTIFNGLGRVNNKTFWGQQPHSLLLTGAEINRIRSPYGTWVWNVAFLMKWSSIVANGGTLYGHNSFYDFNPTAGHTIKPYQVTIDGNIATPPIDADVPNPSADAGKTVFEDFDFNQLWVGP